MFYRPRKFYKMWDTWLYHHEGIHYLYHLHMVSSPGDGVALARSTDGVHWEELGEVIPKADDAEWLGTGSVFPVGEKFMMNFSEMRNGIQAIFFAESTDLVHWRRLEEEYRCDPDPRWYDDTPAGRWDCIYTLRKEGGGFWGYLTANPWTGEQRPSGLPYRSIGMVESDDGLHWRAIAPPVVEWGDLLPSGMEEMTEVGAIERIGRYYHLMLGSFGAFGNACGMYSFVGDHPCGPFRPDAGAYKLLTSGSRKMAYFTRFYRLWDDTLVNHHAISRSDMRWFSPLKRAVVDEEPHLRLGYWEGNEAAKGKKLPIDLATCRIVNPRRGGASLDVSTANIKATATNEGALLLFPEPFQLERGLVLEGFMKVPRIEDGLSKLGIYFEVSDERGVAMVSNTSGTTEIGPVHPESVMDLRPEETIETGLSPGEEHEFRLLMRHSLTEFYIDDRLVQCYSIPEKSSGTLGFVFGPGKTAIWGLKAWEMNFSTL